MIKFFKVFSSRFILEKSICFKSAIICNQIIIFFIAIIYMGVIIREKLNITRKDIKKHEEIIRERYTKLYL